MALMTQRSSSRLFTLAQDQGGYFTAKQALGCGYGYQHLAYHLSTGTIERVDHGIYRFAQMARPDHHDLIELSFWSRNRADEPQAVVSHVSALVLHELTNLIPSTIHLTVPPTFRKRAPAGCVLHKALLTTRDAEDRMGFQVTTPMRTLLDVASDGISMEELEYAVAKAITDGVVRMPKLRDAVSKNPSLKRMHRLLDSLPKRRPS